MRLVIFNLVDSAQKKRGLVLPVVKLVIREAN